MKSVVKIYYSMLSRKSKEKPSTFWNLRVSYQCSACHAGPHLHSYLSMHEIDYITQMCLKYLRELDMVSSRFYVKSIDSAVFILKERWNDCHCNSSCEQQTVTPSKRPLRVSCGCQSRFHVKVTDCFWPLWRKTVQDIFKLKVLVCKLNIQM